MSKKAMLQQPVFQDDPNKGEELRRIIRLVQFARVSALDVGEHDACAQLFEAERLLRDALSKQNSPRSA